MKTILDDYREVSLVVVTEDINEFYCKVVPMKVGAQNRIVEDDSGIILEIKFGLVSGYLVVPEIIQVGLNLQCTDSFALSEVINSSMLDSLGFSVLQKANKHIVLKTSHQYVNVFLDSDETETMGELVTVKRILNSRAAVST